jgi:guanylate kinase
MKNTLLFLTGLSGSGKGYFFDNFLPRDRFYKLVSATTRKARDGEQDGREYYFRDQRFFDSEKFATYLFVNRGFCKPGDEKWLYGVPEQEIKSNLGKDLVYDVIQPMYVRQMIDWFQGQKIDGYEFRVAYFLPPQDNFQIAEKRAVMKNDLDVRRTNTCDPIDFLRAGIQPDWFVRCSAAETIIPKSLRDFYSR